MITDLAASKDALVLTDGSTVWQLADGEWVGHVDHVGYAGGAAYTVMHFRSCTSCTSPDGWPQPSGSICMCRGSVSGRV